jgi:hypothetical protein
MAWTKYIPEGDNYIPVSKWGRDHWSTLAYVETRCVDYDGVIRNERMRCNPRVHREFMHGGDGRNHPTILAGGETVDRHDDWSCLEDAAAAGFVEVEFDTDDCLFGDAMAKVRMTDLGWEVVAKLRKHKGNGGCYEWFRLK